MQLVLITPESAINNPLYRSMFLSTKYQEKLAALVIDEAHCVKTWGDDFRKAFAAIGNLRSIRIPFDSKCNGAYCYSYQCNI